MKALIVGLSRAWGEMAVTSTLFGWLGSWAICCPFGRAYAGSFLFLAVLRRLHTEFKP